MSRLSTGGDVSRMTVHASQIVFVLMCDGMSTDASPVTFQHLPAAFCMPQLQ